MTDPTGVAPALAPANDRTHATTVSFLTALSIVDALLLVGGFAFLSGGADGAGPSLLKAAMAAFVAALMLAAMAFENLLCQQVDFELKGRLFLFLYENTPVGKETLWLQAMLAGTFTTTGIALLMVFGVVEVVV